MRIEDLKDYEVRISANTLTAKDENGKTRGLVRGVRRFENAPGRDQFDAATKARKSTRKWQRMNGKSLITK